MLDDKSQISTPNPIILGECEFVASSGTIVRGDQSTNLGPKSIEVLIYLLEHKGQVVSRDQFMEDVWGGRYVTDSQLSKHILELRRAFGDTQKPRRYIETLSKRGYQLICDTEVVADHRVSSGPADTSPIGREKRSSLPWKGFSAATVLVVLVASVAFSYLLLRSNQDDAVVAPSRVVDTEPSIESPSIVVLPFLDLSEEQNQEYLSDGMTDELLNLLAQNPDIRVVSRTSSFYFKENIMEVPAIAARLNVEHVLQGSISREGDRVRVTAQLIDAELDSHVWSQSFDSEFDNIFAIQAEIVTAVTERFQLTLLENPSRLDYGNSEVYTLYLQARFFQKQLTPEGRAAAVAFYLQVLELEPEHLGALAALGLTYMDQVWTGELSPEEGQVLSMGVINRALAVDPLYAPLYLGLAFQMVFTNDIETSSGHFQRAVELAPSDADIMFEWAVSKFISYGYEEALRISDYLEARDPLNPMIYAVKARTYALTSQWEQAAENSRTALKLSPGHNDAGFSLGVALLHMGEADAALAAFQQDQRLERTIGLTLAHHALGHESQFRTGVAELEAGWAQSSPSAMAEIYAYLNDKEAAFEWLEKALEFDQKRLVIHTSPLLISLHDDPRWTTLLEEIGTSKEQLEVYALERNFPRESTLDELSSVD